MTADTLSLQSYTCNVYESVKCEICPLAFQTSAERNVHILSHFQQLSCSVCQQSLIRIGDTWYAEHSDHAAKPKTEPINDEGNEYANATTGDIIDPISGGSCATRAEHHINVSENTCTGAIECRPEQVMLPEFIEQKPYEIVHSEYTEDYNEPDDLVIGNSVGNCAKETGLNKPNTAKCPLCDKVMLKRSLKFHMNIHEGIKPFECGTCHVAYADKRNLYTHIKKSKHTMKDISGTKMRKSNRNVSLADESSVKTQTERSDTFESVLVKTEVNQCQMDCELKTDDDNNAGDDDTTPILDKVLEANLMPFATMRNECNDIIDNSTVDSRPDDVQIKLEDESKQDEAKEEEEEEVKDKAKRPVFESVCEICDMRFASKTGLKYHFNIHHGLKPYVCGESGKTFANKRNMSEHEKMHERTKQPIPNDYIKVDGVEVVLTRDQLLKQECPICRKIFASKRSLRIHVEIHGEKRIRCRLCEKLFASVKYYRRHKNKVHAGKNETSVQKDLRVEDYEDGMASSIPVDWMCEYCNMDFEFEIRLARHIVKEHSDAKQEHPCNICEVKFAQSQDLLMHMRGHPESNQHKCDFDGCGEGFAFKSSLAVHMNKHTRLSRAIERKTQDHLSDTTKKLVSNERDSELECMICNKTFQSRTLMLAHMNGVHTNKRMKCPVDGCEKFFKTNPGVISHMQMTHPNELKRCETCNKTFCTDDLLAKHQLRHQRVVKQWFACTSCDRKLPTKHALRMHMKHHEKDTQCNICLKTFTNVKYMTAHRERHGKKVNLKCRFKDCNQVFENRSELMRHAITHPDNEKRKVICSYCGKGMCSAQSLRDHINMHTGEKPYQCNQCEKCFGKASTLSRHQMIHSGKKPYVCDIDGCQHTYRDSIDLKRHKFSAHKIYTKKHICPICEQIFPERKLLTKHTINIHGKIDTAKTSQSN